MKINIFYNGFYIANDPTWHREMDILESDKPEVTVTKTGRGTTHRIGKTRTHLQIVEDHLAKEGLNWHTMTYGPQVRGWSKEMDFNVFAKEPDERDLSITLSLYPTKQYGGYTEVIVNKKYKAV